MINRVKRVFSGHKITKGAALLFGLEAACSILGWILADPQLYESTISSGGQVFHEGRVWTLLTSPFFLFSSQWFSLIFHGLILWLFFPVLENWWGLKRFLKFAAATILASMIAGTVAGYFISGQLNRPINGLDAFTYAGIVGYGILYSTRDVTFFGVLPMKGRQLMQGIIGFALVFTILTKEWAVGASYAASMVTAWILVSGKWNPKLWRLKAKQKKARKHLTLLQGGAKKSDKMLN